MEYTEQQKATFKQQFALRRRRQIILAIPMMALFLVFAFLADEKGEPVLPGVPPTGVASFFVAVVVGTIVFSLRNWRCPACDRYLAKGMSPHFCSKCGVALQ